MDNIGEGWRVVMRYQGGWYLLQGPGTRWMAWHRRGAKLFFNRYHAESYISRCYDRQEVET